MKLLSVEATVSDNVQILTLWWDISETALSFGDILIYLEANFGHHQQANLLEISILLTFQCDQYRNRHFVLIKQSKKHSHFFCNYLSRRSLIFNWYLKLNINFTPSMYCNKKRQIIWIWRSIHGVPIVVKTYRKSHQDSFVFRSEKIISITCKVFIIGINIK